MSEAKLRELPDGNRKQRRSSVAKAAKSARECDKAELAALRARVAELEAHNADLQERLTASERSLYELEDTVGISAQTRDQLRERAERAEAVIARVRAKAAAWKAESATTAEQRYTKGSTEHREGYGEAQGDCADDLEAVLPPKP